MPPKDGLYDIETGYKIQHGDIAESILQELRSLPEGMQAWFCQAKNGWYDTSGGGLLASTENAYIRNNDGRGRTVQRIHLVL